MQKIILMLLISLSSLFSMDIAIIANRNIIEDKIDKAELASIYTLNTTYWKDGTDIKVFDFRASAEKKIFYDFINKSEPRLKKTWLKLKLSEGIEIPELVSSSEQMLIKVAKTEGAIGYISKDQVNSTVKVIAEITI